MFLTRAALSQKIKEVLEGRDVDCAVAFWGQGSASLLAQAKGRRPRVICNVTSGGTNPKALTDLRELLGGDLRHQTNLHAKVYLSNRGLVVGSANASNHGIGLADGAQADLLEAGSFYGPETSHWRKASDWFEEIFAPAPVVDDAAIATAQRTWMPPRAPTLGRIVEAENSLLNLVSERPDAFHDIGFVFVAENNDPATIEALNQEEQDEGGQADPPWDMHNAFTHWPHESASSWPARHFLFWVRGRPRVYPREVVKVKLEDEIGHVLTRSCAQQMRRWLRERDVHLPSMAAVAAADGPLAKQLCADGGQVYRSSFELIDAIRSLRD